MTSDSTNRPPIIGCGPGFAGVCAASSASTPTSAARSSLQQIVQAAIDSPCSILTATEGSAVATQTLKVAHLIVDVFFLCGYLSFSAAGEGLHVSHDCCSSVCSTPSAVLCICYCAPVTVWWCVCLTPSPY